MDFATFWLPIIGGVLLGGVAGNAWYGGDRVLAIWVGSFGLVSFLLLIALQLIKAITVSAIVAKIERPYVSIASIGFPDDKIKTGAIVIKWGIKNGGKSVVTITEANMTLFFEIVKNPIPDTPTHIPNPHTLSGIEIGPGDKFLAEFRQDPPLSTGDIAAINEKRLRLYVYGYIKFRDDSGVSDCRGFIAYYDPASTPAYGMFRWADEDHPQYRNCK